MFSSEEAGNDWIAPAPQVRSMEASELVHELVQELAYICRNSEPADVYRTGRMKDMVRALNAASAFAGASLAECLLTAWMEIKDRKGRMVDGVFVKQEDLPPVVYGSGTVRSPEQEAPVPPDHNC